MMIRLSLISEARTLLIRVVHIGVMKKLFMKVWSIRWLILFTIEMFIDPFEKAKKFYHL